MNQRSNSNQIPINSKPNACAMAAAEPTESAASFPLENCNKARCDELNKIQVNPMRFEKVDFDIPSVVFGSCFCLAVLSLKSSPELIFILSVCAFSVIVVVTIGATALITAANALKNKEITAIKSSIGKPPVVDCGLGNPQSNTEQATHPTTGGAA